MTITVTHLSKAYHVPVPGQTRWRRIFQLQQELRPALEDVSFQVGRGETVGYIGPNGSGKSTTIKCLTGIVTPDHGTVDIGGLNPARDRLALNRQQSVLFGQKSLLFWDLAVIDGLKLFSSIYRLERSVFETRVRDLARAFDAAHLLDRPARKLSLGERMRCEIITALLHAPQTLYLDEPTIGLDVVAREQLYVLLRRFQRERDLTLMLTTHQVADLEELCPRVIVLHSGRIIFDGALGALKRRTQERRVMDVEYQRLVNAGALHALTELAAHVTHDERSRRIQLELLEADVPRAHRLLAEACDIASLKIGEQPLEKVLVEVFSRGAAAYA